MKPAIGRIVIYFAKESERHNGQYIHPAVITRVHSDACVNLKVSFDAGPVEHRDAVVMAGPGELHNGGRWSWPVRE